MGEKAGHSITSMGKSELLKYLVSKKDSLASINVPLAIWNVAFQGVSGVWNTLTSGIANTENALRAGRR
jgi:hypothetical protein